MQTKMREEFAKIFGEGREPSFILHQDVLI